MKSSTLIKSATGGKLAATALALLMTIVLTASTAGAVSCHCFNQRDFDPDDPSSADPYVMATARNGLLAAAVGVEKSSIVRARMGGAGEANLWIAFKAGERAGVEPGELLDAKEDLGTWQKALDANGVSADVLGEDFARSLASSDEQGAAVLADRVLAASFSVSTEQLAALRAEGADTAAATTALYLSKKTRRPALEIFNEVKGGKASWGSLLNRAGTAPAALSDEVAAAVAAAK